MDLIPRRVAEDAVEAAGPAAFLVSGVFRVLGDGEYVGEGQVEMDELIFLG